MTNSPEISRPNPGEVKGTDLTKEQLASASDFLAALGWTESEPIRQPTRDRVALLIAWYGALRYQAAAHQLGSYEAPSRLIETTQKQSTHLAQQRQEPTFELLDLADITVRSL